MATAARTHRAAGQMTFEDVAVYFSQEEWALLDDAQMRLYQNVMMENLSLILALGGCYREAEGPLLDRVSEPSIPSPDSSFLKTPSCEEWVTVAKDPLLYLPEHQGTQTGPELYIHGVDGKLSLSLGSNLHKQQGDKKRARMENRALPVKSCKIHISDKVSTCGELEAYSPQLVQHQVANNRKRPQRYRENTEAPHPLQMHHNYRKCGQSFDVKCDLSKHRRAKTGEKRYECRECGKCFKHSSSLSHHRKVHSGEKPYKCSECEKSFVYKRTFLEHQRIHTGEKPHACNECGKLFRHRSSLSKHRQCHSGKRLYKCSECNKSFTHKGRLLRHERIHSGEVLYDCKGCGESFRQKPTLSKHRKHHGGGRGSKCSKCGKSFGTFSQNFEQQSVHAGEKPCKCSTVRKCLNKRFRSGLPGGARG